MFKIQCDHVTTIDGQPFAVSDYVRLFVRNDKAFGASLAALFAGVRIEAKPLEIESADMAVLRAALEQPTNGYLLNPPQRAAPFVRALLDAKEEP